MMKMNAGAWIGIIGAIIGVVVAIIAVITTTGSMGIYITAGILLLIFGMCYLFYKILFAPMINSSRLQKNGIPGTARIISVNDTGVTINNNPQVKLNLEVKNSFGQRYNASCRVLVSRINPNAYAAGMEVPVKIDPKNEQNVVLDFTSSAATATAGSNSTMVLETLKADLEKLQQENDSINSSGKPARAIIKKYTWLGAYVNGNNPYAELELEVLPENAAAFSGKAKGVIAASSVNKYQPGGEIFVKYDQYDNSRIAIDHS
jgi:citrate lyase gamma subunit